MPGNKHKAGTIDCMNADTGPDGAPGCGAKGLKMWQVAPGPTNDTWLCGPCSVAANVARGTAGPAQHSSNWSSGRGR